MLGYGTNETVAYGRVGTGTRDLPPGPLVHVPPDGAWVLVLSTLCPTDTKSQGYTIQGRRNGYLVFPTLCPADTKSQGHTIDGRRNGHLVHLESSTGVSSRSPVLPELGSERRGHGEVHSLPMEGVPGWWVYVYCRTLTQGCSRTAHSGIRPQ